MVNARLAMTLVCATLLVPLPFGHAAAENEPEPFVVRIEWNGMLACGIGAADVGWATCSTIGDPTDDFMFTWTAAPSLHEVVVGLRWHASGDLDDELSLHVANRVDEIAHGEGTSPIVETGEHPSWFPGVDEVELLVRVFAGGDPGVAYQLPFEVVIEEYHNQPAPEGRDPFEPIA